MTSDLTYCQSTASARLKSQTALSHRRLDSLPAIRRLVSSGLDETSYRNFLHTFAEVWSPLEAGLEHSLSHGPGDELSEAAATFYLRRRDALARDVVETGASHAAGSGLPPMDVDHRCSSIQTLGRLYVLLGAQLGSVHIERSIVARLPDAPLAFFRARFSDLPRRWRDFTLFLDRVVVDEKGQQEMVGAANATYQQFFERMR